MIAEQYESIVAHNYNNKNSKRTNVYEINYVLALKKSTTFELYKPRFLLCMTTSSTFSQMIDQITDNKKSIRCS